MKSVLMSIRPKWCELIASGNKTIEVRKTKPKIEMPFKVYIYCTKPSKHCQTICGSMVLNSDELYRHPTQGFKYGDSIELMCCDDYSKDNFLNGKVIGEFVCDDIDTISVHNETLYCENNSQANKLQQMCLSVEKIKKYLGQKNLGYNWHISDLKIYDKPKELSEFYKCDIDIQQIDEMGDELCKYCKATDYGDHKSCSTPNGPIFCEGAYCGEAYDEYRDQLYDENSLTRPPQSWCYVEGEE